MIRLARSYSLKDATVLIEGETGTGKELVAGQSTTRALEAASVRRGELRGIAESLFESELFGHTRGAFTGALAGSKGQLERAHGGTLLLDEIDSTPLPVQGKILRAVETKRVARINGKREIAVDVRIIAAGNKDLAQEAPGRPLS